MTRQKFARRPRVIFSSVVLAVSALLCAIGVPSAYSQSIEQPPIVSIIDENGVNLATGKPTLPGLDISIGGDGSGLARVTNETGDNFSGKIVSQYAPLDYMGANGYWFLNVSYGGSTYRFQVTTYTNGNQAAMPTPYKEYGGTATLECTLINGGTIQSPMKDCVLTLDDGTQANFIKDWLTTVNLPDGSQQLLTYYKDANNTPKAVNTVNSTQGWALKYTIDSNFVVTGVTAVNTTSAQCDETICNAPSDSPTVMSGTDGTAKTILRNNIVVARIVTAAASTTVTLPVSQTVARTYNTTSGRVSSVVAGGSTWTYAYVTDSAGATTTTVTLPNGQSRKVLVSYKKLVDWTMDEAGRKTILGYDSNGRLWQTLSPDGAWLTGGFTSYYRDGSGRLEFQEITPKNSTSNGVPTPGTTLVTAMTYEPCTTATRKYCMKPLTVTDSNGIKTTYTYNAANGQVATVTRPAVNGVTAQTRYTYQQKVPQAKIGGTSLVAQPPVWKLTQISSCMSSNWTGSACGAGAIDESRTSIGYTGSDNLLPIATTIARGDGTLSQASAVAYDARGLVLVNDGPLPGTADETYSFYDTLGRNIGSVGSDPDGSSSRKRQAARSTYDSDGRAWKIESGTVATSAYTGTTALLRYAQAKTDLNALSVQTSDTTEFNSSSGLPIVSRHYVGSATGTPKDVVQRSYDNMFRVDCEAVRLKSADYTNLAGLNACSLGTATGSETVDQITKYGYNPVTGALVSTTSAYATGAARQDFLKSFDISSTSSGMLKWIEDAKGNRTSYSYDNFNRVIKICYPHTSSLHTSSATDCDQTTYRTAPIAGTATTVGTLINTVTLRDNQVVTLSYDLAGRVSSKSGAIAETFTYNNFDAVTQHTNSTTGHMLNATTPASQTDVYNALGWLLSTSVNIATAADSSTTTNKAISYQYDAYGRRSQLTYPDGFYVTYGYNDAGEIVRICENGANCVAGNVSLVNFSYDDYARPTVTSVRKTDGTALVIRSLGYDASLRLQTVAAPGNTVTLGYTPADQISTRSNSASVFDPTAPIAGTTAYGVNGLNQMSSAGASTLGYDARGNMSTDGAVTYTYNAGNLLTQTSTATLRYDAESRLRLEGSASNVTRQLIYDGVDLIAEYDMSGALKARYVHGFAGDQPLVWYVSTGPSTFDKRFYASDERGSITTVTNDAGTILAQYGYDAYGVPVTVSGTTDSRFRYTGQVWFGDISLYNYKARMYAPSLGRFVQTDPIGYGDGMNWYAYVHNDPINGADPTGLGDDTTVVVTGDRPMLDADQAYDYLWSLGQDGLNYFNDMAQAYKDYNTPSDPMQCAADTAKGALYGTPVGIVIGGTVVAGGSAITAVPTGGGSLVAGGASMPTALASGGMAGGLVGGAIGNSVSAACHNGGSSGGGGGGSSGAGSKASVAPNKAKIGDTIDLKKFTERLKGGKFRDPDSGYMISKDRAGTRGHGGSAWKLENNGGGRVATLNSDGKLLRY